MLHRIAKGRTDLVFDHVEGGGDPSAADGAGTSLLAWCAYYGDVSAMRYLLTRGADLATLGPNFDLNGAAFHGHWRLCQFLLEHGADANHPLHDTDERPLHAALSVANRPGNEMAARVLLAAGADPNVATRAGALTGCFMREARTCGESPLHRAAAFASLQAIRDLIAAGARIDARDSNGDPPLAWASWHQRPSDVLRALAFQGSRPLHPHAHWASDHGQGWRGMDQNLLGGF